ncbi:deoxyribose-phosphate aldolase [Corynebacterium rhinophilum]|uniref:deoxyribose-phosphate aldolase n=1 Tax=Corynebacterium rhinophilum TaxID=3050197 RepID=UPI00254D55D2|nr:MULTISPECIES: deoxyribose-phosphate aldolase [unclassified Corynebacterium]MDK8451615.1 deoxyribose-phosphate aldolase [Corynebacterium sp. MSK084]MDK8513551.1 deoxyribose-phosphate aldolase [Corynebacterium sp. MSK123]MDK8547073.1 deoxyribose-phosphate aldolase [Corynebacterium sp. MSK222]
MTSQNLTRSDVASYIDHTLLKPEATPEQFRALAEEATELGTYAVCVSPSALPLETPESLHVATVVGFPSGAVKPEIKAAEAARAVADGAEEVDMVINIPLTIEGRAEELQAEIQAVRDAIPGKVLKVIIESAALSDASIVLACQAAAAAQADFVKTSTGFHPAGGASTHAVKLMRETVGNKLGVKASGGIRTAEDALAMIEAGASRLGLSSSAKILEEL